MSTATPAVDASASDIPKGGWADRFVPAPARPYVRLARLDRPIGSWLLLFPCWWSLALASPDPLTWEFLRLLVLFGIGAVVMRGAGCTYNDICDRHMDAQVARTADRPLPSGQVTVAQAVAFMAFLLVLGAAILFSMGRAAIWVGVASLALVFTYPLMKRVTFWPQFFLGLAFNWGALLAWAAVRDGLALPAYVLYAGGILWTLGYDTIYAHQDRRDDPKAGIKSSARRLGLGSKPWLYAFYVGAAALFAAAGWAADLAWPFYLGLALGLGQLVWQVADVDLNGPKDCLAKFKSNRLFGWIMLAAVILGQLAA
jgi:4-hydroxybenzoate polyprenyltransferase